MKYVIGQECVGCHSCKYNCPRDCISFVDAKYRIDPSGCIQCGTCAKVCPIDAIYDADAPETEPEHHERMELECDVLVVGSGAGGMVAAVRAAEQTGGKVLVIESAKRIGGNSRFAHGFFVDYCRLQQEAGMPDTREDTIRRHMFLSHWGCDPKVVRKAVYSSGPFSDWLWDQGGAEEYFQLIGEFKEAADVMVPMPNLSFPRRRNSAADQCRDQSIGPGWMGSYVVDKMYELFPGYGIRLLTQTRGKEFVRDDSGRYTALLAEDTGGEVLIRFKACVLATGGMLGDREKVRKYFPGVDAPGSRPFHCLACPTSRGDAITMGEKMGAWVDYENFDISLLGPAMHPYDSYSLYRIMRRPEALYVNQDGKRWIDETAGLHGSARELLRQRGQTAWAVFDDRSFEMFAKEHIEHPFDGTETWILEGYRQDLEYGQMQDHCAKTADTLEELAVQIGVDPAALLETVDRYNHACDLGLDEDFSKDPRFLVPVKHGPFHAFWGQVCSEVCLGGVRINDKGEVLEPDGTPFGGIYAVGDNAMGIRAKGGPGAVSCLGWACFSGWFVGDSIREYLSNG